MRKLSLLAALLFFVLGGCGTMSAAEKRAMAKAWIKVGHQAACAAALLACKQHGGSKCEDWAGLGCMVGGSVVDALAVSVPPSTTEISGHVTRAMATVPSVAKRVPGFKTPTTDSQPLKIQ